MTSLPRESARRPQPINDPSHRVFIARNGRHELTNLMLTSAQVDELRAGSKSSGLEQDVQVSGRFLRLALRAARPVMVWNHERMMRGCLAGLHVRLDTGSATN